MSTVVKCNKSDRCFLQSPSTHRTYNLNPKKPPKVYDYKTCVEVDSQFFYSGVPWDMTARNYSVLTINLAFNTSLTAHDVIALNLASSYN
jgi:hypothetical protein